eukprot:354033-Chlamydomonas_euryale.AAC.1
MERVGEVGNEWGCGWTRSGKGGACGCQLRSYCGCGWTQPGTEWRAWVSAEKLLWLWMDTAGNRVARVGVS